MKGREVPGSLGEPRRNQEARRASWGLHPAFALAFVFLAFWLTGCTTPVGADRVPLRTAYKEIDRSALNSSKPSADTLLVLYRYDLRTPYKKDPGAALAALHGIALKDTRRDVLFALSELSFLHAGRLARAVRRQQRDLSPGYYLASVVYAWEYLSTHEADPKSAAFNRYFRNACDLYNRALPLAFVGADSSHGAVSLAEGSRTVPFGSLRVSLSTNNFPWPMEEFSRFLPANAYKLRGVTVRNRNSGIGAPLIGVVNKPISAKYVRSVPATLFGRLEGGLEEVRRGEARLTLEMLSPYDCSTVEFRGKQLPLETDLTAPLAYALNDSAVWRLGSQQFLTAIERVKTGVYPFQPFEPNRIPVVFVHGTFSSPVWWVEMMNTLFSDRALRERCQFWFFIYNSGNPVSYSAGKLRDALTQEIARLDPAGTNVALRQMVIIGHSQGGLLTKLTATHTGDALWNTAFKQPLDSMKVSDDKRRQLQANFFYEPLPFVRRVVFISTPHRGSHLATSFVRNLARRFMTLPTEVVDFSKTMLQLDEASRLPSSVWRTIPTSLDNMSPRSEWLQALADRPVATNVTAHSIIAVKGDAQPPEGGDGVVKYASAHVTYTDSEFIVRSGHSCQDKPAAIEEVRRILLEHLNGAGGGPRTDGKVTAAQAAPAARAAN
jgi:pimeloyl-ACP methyl ester carboxylesterase